MICKLKPTEKHRNASLQVWQDSFLKFQSLEKRYVSLKVLLSKVPLALIFLSVLLFIFCLLSFYLSSFTVLIVKSNVERIIIPLLRQNFELANWEEICFKFLSVSLKKTKRLILNTKPFSALYLNIEFEKGSNSDLFFFFRLNFKKGFKTCESAVQKVYLKGLI